VVEEPPGGFQTLAELEAEASRRLPADVWAYIQGGAGPETTVRENQGAFRRWQLWPRPLAGIREVDLRTTLLGAPVAAPIFVAPTAYQTLIHRGGEVATARAASAAHLLAVFSTLSSLSLEAIAEAAPVGPRWFQLYLQPDFSTTTELIRRAEKAGYTAIVVTVDAPVLGVRDRQTRDGVAIRSPVPSGNGPHIRPPARVPEYADERFVFPPDAAVDWSVLTQIRGVTHLPIVVKGILAAEDARLAVEAGARAVVVSNHGGRQLDAAVPTIEALPGVVAAIGSRAEVYMDGGVRRGTDVLTALALGARAVGIGRPVLWALAVGGEAGVARLFSLLTMELAVSMMLAGRKSVEAIGAATLHSARS
jgi:4-hydroxymandelate oxidase